jgi:AcrR family transcriptional regulator
MPGEEDPVAARDKRGRASSTGERLLGVAARVFRTKGYSASTTRELASELGIRRASLYHHITAKEDLLHEICRRALSRIENEVRTAGSGQVDAAERLRRMIRAHVESAMADMDMHAVMLVELRALAPEHRADVVAMRDAYEALFRDAILEAQRQGSLRSDIDAKYLTLALLNLLNWTIFWFKPGDDLQPGELASILIQIFLEGARGELDVNRGTP